MFFLIAVLVGLGCVHPAPGDAPGPARTLARQILDDSGVHGGLIVHVGCGDGKLTAALHADGRYLVHGLDRSAGRVAKAREYVTGLGLYGPVSVDRLTGGRLPYTDNLVNLVVSEDLGDISMDEVLRVLAPGGAACIERDGKWTRTVKRRPASIDEWTHFLHGPDNNAVAEDGIVGPPHHLQWRAAPTHARSHEHLGTVGAAVSSGGRIFYIVDAGPIASVALPSRWLLVARDAFNGVKLWQRPIEPWESHLGWMRSGPAWLARRLVAVDERVYVTLGYGKPVTALDSATGRTVMTYAGTEGTYEIIADGGLLFLVAGNAEDQAAAAADWRRGRKQPVPSTLIVLEADTGKLIWRKSDADTTDLMPTTLAVSGARVFCQNAREVICLNAQTGREQWRARRPVAARRPASTPPTLVVYGDVVLSADPLMPARSSGRGDGTRMGELIAFSAKTGRKLWTAECSQGYCSPSDVLVANGLVWTGHLWGCLGPGMTAARDPATGRVRKRRPPDQEFFDIGMSHHRCYRAKATDRYILLSRAGVEFLDVESGDIIPHHWIRGTCQFGILPCNGLLYVTPHACACYIEAKLNGLLALAPRRRSERVPVAPPPDEAEARLEPGPAFDTARAKQAAGAARRDWPTYRHDAARSGSTESAVAAGLKPTWQTRVEGRLSAPTVAGGRVFVSSIDAHAVFALDGEDGRVLWSRTVGGRADSPPTIWKGLALFGSADGWVYCLRASDGELVWRFRAAPEDRRIVSHGRLESAWPVHGSVLVQNGAAYFAAGRSSYLDGGIYVYSLEPETGRMLSATRIDSRDPKTGHQPNRAATGFDMPGSVADILSGDGEHVFMRHKVFARDGAALDSRVTHLFSPGGFLDDSWWHRTYWLVGRKMGSGYRDWAQAAQRGPTGRILVRDGNSVYGYGRTKLSARNSHVGFGGLHDVAFGANIEGPGGSTATTYLWTQEVPLLVRAMVLADKTLFLAGPPDMIAQKDHDAVAALEGKKGGMLWAVSPADGGKLADYKLDSSPVFDGMAAAGGRLYMALHNGRVICMGSSAPAAGQAETSTEQGQKQ